MPVSLTDRGLRSLPPRGRWNDGGRYARRSARYQRLLLVLLAGLFAGLAGLLEGCSNTLDETLLPQADILARLPDNRQTELLAPNSVSPTSGPIGTIVTVHGQGRIFPKGFARFVFRGNAVAEVEVPAATGALTVKIPQGTESGAFGFTIAGRTSGRDNSGQIPSDTNMFAAYTVDDPGFTVTPEPVIRRGIDTTRPIRL